MADKTGIGWTNATWNPVRGCERVSEGCKKCYAEELAARHSYPGGWGEGLAKWVVRPDGTKEARWTGVIQTLDRMLDAPLKWREPRRIFVNSMSDLFHKDVSFDFIDKVYAVMGACDDQQRGHTFQILTKRPDRMLEYVTTRARAAWNGPRMDRSAFPPRNVWHGISAEDQKEFDERTPLLLQTPSAKRFVSIEPLLGHVDLIGKDEQGSALHAYEDRPRLDWGIVGAESGSDFRPMDMEAARYVIRQFQGAGVPLFVKQDNGPRPGMKGRFTDAEWALKEYPQ